MKPVNDTINTIPDGTWEAGQTNETLQNCHRTSPSGSRPEKNYPPHQNEMVEPLPESERPRKDGPGGD